MSQVLNRRAERHVLFGSLCAVGARIVGSVEVIDAVVTAVGGVETAGVVVRVAVVVVVAFGQLVLLLFHPALLHGLTVLHHLVVGALVGTVADGSAQSSTTGHTDNGADV